MLTSENACCAKLGCDVHLLCSTSQVGRQPIHYAAEEGHSHAVEVLMDYMGSNAIWHPVADKVGRRGIH